MRWANRATPLCPNHLATPWGPSRARIVPPRFGAWAATTNPPDEAGASSAPPPGSEPAAPTALATPPSAKRRSSPPCRVSRTATSVSPSQEMASATPPSGRTARSASRHPAEDFFALQADAVRFGTAVGAVAAAVGPQAQHADVPRPAAEAARDEQPAVGLCGDRPRPARRIGAGDPHPAVVTELAVKGAVAAVAEQQAVGRVARAVPCRSAPASAGAPCHPAERRGPPARRRRLRRESAPSAGAAEGAIERAVAPQPGELRGAGGRLAPAT